MRDISAYRWVGTEAVARYLILNTKPLRLALLELEIHVLPYIVPNLYSYFSYHIPLPTLSGFSRFI